MSLTDKNKKKTDKNKTITGKTVKSDPSSNSAKGNPDKSNADKKTPWMFYLITVFIPILFFILLEFSLRFFNYGINTSQWIQMPSGKMMLNPDIAHRYFYTTQNVPYSNQEVFDKAKASNSFRVFVLGESSAAGYPYMPVGAFSDYLRKRLDILYPNSKIEVVNLSMTAINTYALRDMFPGVLDQKPDLVLIYTGHNEYYGALGVGSMESVGHSPSLIRFVIYLNKFKTVELLRNIMSSMAKMFKGKASLEQEGTLMSRIVKDQYIAYGSEEYKAGLNQFESNMKDILQMAKQKNVPVVIGTLASNIKDQKPFISLKVSGQPEAQTVYQNAVTELNRGNIKTAEALFRKAKDLDGLRFRAPEELNNIIRSLGKEFRYPVVEVDSAFNAVSPNGIVGDNLMIDHLHPKLQGYQLIGKLYYDVMKKSNLLPKSEPVKIMSSKLDSLAVAQCNFSRLDSAIGSYRILILKNDWPFVDKNSKRPIEELVRPKDYIDTLAIMVCFENHPWEEVHRKAAEWYLRKNNFSEFQKQVDILIDRFPIVIEYYTFMINNLLIMKRYEDAYSYLEKYHEIRPDAYSTKWLGIIDLSRQKADKALSYLKESMQYNSNDAQVLYNLSGAYVAKNDYKKALETIDQCLQVEPEFPGANNLKSQLSAAVTQAK